MYKIYLIDEKRTDLKMVEIDENNVSTGELHRVKLGKFTEWYKTNNVLFN